MDHLLLMHKFLSGEISGDENEKFDQWLTESPKNREAFEEIKFIWDNSDFGEEELAYDPLLEMEKLKERIQMAREAEGPRITAYSTNNVNSNILKFAAIALVLICSNVLAWYYVTHSAGGQLALVNHGQYNIIELPDGSKAYLNRNTTLSFDRQNDNREVYLKGEAYFEIIKDQGRPFIVHLPKAAVKVLGTSFNVNARSDRDSAIVTVTTGTIEFFNSAYKVEVGKGEKASMVNKNQKIIKSINTDPNFDAWKTGELKFNNTELSSILLVLENYYGISFRASNSDILSCRFTGTFQNDRLESVLQVLSFGLNFKYRFDEGGYILTGEGCNKSN